MIIECPACTSRYRIREDKLPEAGGNIKCPNCAHIFFVPREGSASQSGSSPVIGNTAEVAGPRVEDSEGAVTAAPPEGAQRWKLRNAVGLVYDFQTTEQLRKWLGTRESHEGFDVSSDAGASWRALPEVDELSDVEPTGRKTVGPQPAAFRASGVQRAAQAAGLPGSGGANGAFPASAEKMREEAQARLKAAKRQRQVDNTGDHSGSHEFHVIKPPPTRQQQQATRILTILSIIILPLLALAVLHGTGVVDLGELGFGGTDYEMPVYVPPPDRPEERGQNRGVELTPDQAVSRLISLAGAAQSRGEPDAALEHLEQATEIMPDDAELFCLLVPLYTEMERQADATRAQERCDAANAPEGAGSGDAAPAEDAAAPTDGSGAAAPAAIDDEGSGVAPANP